ncbi:peptide deformylase [Lactobacillus terrae]|uniref:peptide deformylase n=1 Tax=Lactobacillus terrae TaxID=2269374 RepID=UPI000C1B6431|nr:peptide deformylase [Lactobacillus terrae]
MIKSIMADENFLSKKSIPATKDDLNVVNDLMDTLEYHSDNCVGMAANMIGISKNISVFRLGNTSVPMINPVIISKKNIYETSEGCLSLTGERPTQRYQNIKVKYLDINFIEHTQDFSDWIAQIIQHEIDHCNGIII